MLGKTKMLLMVQQGFRDERSDMHTRSADLVTCP